MTQPNRQERIAIDRAFSHYLRTGERHTIAQWQLSEQKFNSHHDKLGRFTFSGHGVAPSSSGSVQMGHGATGGLTGLRAHQNSANRAAIKPKPDSRANVRKNATAQADDIGALSAKYESSGGDPGRISSGKNDPGGVSYGTHQLSSKGRMVDAFIASPMAARWSARFLNLRPNTPEFDAQWRAVAASERSAFETAQKVFLGRERYSRAVNGVAQDTGVNLNSANNAVRQVTWSVAIQHGGAREILTVAVRRTDRSLKRSDSGYQRALINNVYDERIAYTERARMRLLEKGKKSDAKGLENVIRYRLPQERADALLLIDPK